nr:AfsR/SARP family transcriptional regulator [Streptomyces sp. CT34]
MTPSAPKLRQVLAMLVLSANSMVSVERLCEELWGERPPFKALTTLQTYIYQLRQRLQLVTEHTSLPLAAPPISFSPALVTRVGGYELQLEGRQSVDAYRFERLADQGQGESRSGDTVQAVRTFKEALRIWQGQALVDVAGGRRLSAWSTMLEERRKNVMEKRFSLMLEIGQQEAMLDEVSEAFWLHPTHEAFAGLLMRTLSMLGRRGDALDVFRTLRARLVDELGLEPSAELQEMHQQILVDNVKSTRSAAAVRPTVAATASGVTISQLPANTTDFVGRVSELHEIQSYLSAERGSDPGVRVVDVRGRQGVGKTAFAVRAGHRLRQHYPDGQLFVDLSEVGDGPPDITDVLTGVLSSCGFRRKELPSELGELSRLFRSWTADRRALVIIDDVLTSSQLKPFVPGGPGCAVIAVSRYRVPSLSSGRSIEIPSLSSSEALELHNLIADGWSWDSHAKVVPELVGMCEGLPLAIRTLTAKLASRSGWQAARLASRLHSNTAKLLEILVEGCSLGGRVESSYRHLSQEQRRLLCHMAGRAKTHWHVDDLKNLVPGSEDLETLLDSLVDLYLVDELPMPPTKSSRTLQESAYTIPRLIRQALLRLWSERDPLDRAVEHSCSDDSLLHFGARR